MGHYSAVALVVLLAVASAEQLCNTGSFTVDSAGEVVSNNVKGTPCEGFCTARHVDLPSGDVMHIMSCEEKHKVHSADIMCTEDFCNRVDGMSSERPELAVLPQINGTFTCYVGIHHGNYFVGGIEACDGACAHVDAIANGKPSTAYFCTPRSLCYNFITKAKDPVNGCGTIDPSTNMTACCCDHPANCNVNKEQVPTPFPTLPSSTGRVPIACYSGIHLGDTLISGGDYVGCQGDCAMLSYTLSGVLNLTMYSCDPRTVCREYSLTNKCLSVDNGTYYGCCCDTDACIDPKRGVSPDQHKPPLECYVGVHIKNNTGAGWTYDVGSPIVCDGMCGRMTTFLGGNEVEAFYCSQLSLCKALDVVGTCDSRNMANQNITACCCDDSDNCNTHGTDITPVPRSTARPNQIVACYEGVSFNGKPLANSQRFVACDGDCASITLESTSGGSAYNVTLYTCDPSSVCRGLGVMNRCAPIANTTVSGCCCDTDACINPYINKYPTGNSQLECLVGITIGSNFSAGGQLPCNGECASVETVLGGILTAGYFCAPRSLCENIGIHNECQTLLGDQSVTACCCDYSNNCNAQRNNATIPPFSPQNKPPITCYSGISVNGYFPQDANSYVACKGDCGLITFSSSVAGKLYNATMYSCDPVEVCEKMELHNECASSKYLPIRGCCCSWNDCLDITNLNIKDTHDNLQCFVGLSIEGGPNNVTTTYGQSMACDGECATVETLVNGYTTFGFFCAKNKLCDTFDLNNQCNTGFTDTGYVKTCCCNDNDNCNMKNGNIATPTAIPTAPTGRHPIACLSGLAYNGVLVTPNDAYMSCAGDCAQISYTTKVNNKSTTATVFTCDPVSLCSQLGMSDNCSAVQHGNSSTAIFGCCCSWDDCIDVQNLNIKTTPTTPTRLDCLVGITIGTNITIGGQLPCDGECASIETTVNDVLTAGYFCAPRTLCAALSLHNDCSTVLANHTATGCCCDYDNNCNAKRHNVPVPPYIAPTKPPITCYSGLSVNGYFFKDADNYVACRGDCGLITFSTAVSSKLYNITMYTCDPVQVCDKMKLHNTCASSKNLPISGCCCSWNDCLDITNLKVKDTHDNLQCFVGLSIEGGPNNVTTTYGQSVACDGECATVETQVNGYTTFGFFCAKNKLCDTFDLNNQCNTGLTDTGYVTTCCCNDNDNCNMKNGNVVMPTGVPPAPTGRDPITCLSGLAYNGVLVTPNDAYMVCTGDCAQISYTTKVNNKLTTATVFTCDPVSLCSQLGMSDTCSAVQHGNSSTAIFGCCCSSTLCIDTNGLDIKTTTAPPHTGSSSSLPAFLVFVLTLLHVMPYVNSVL